MIRYRLPHEFSEYAFCKWCGSSEMAIEDGRKPRYCAKNRRFKCPGYLSEKSIERACIEIAKKTMNGLAINVTRMIADLVATSVVDGVAFYSVPHPVKPPRLVDPDEWYIKDEDEAQLKTATQVHREQMAADILSRGFMAAGKPKLSAEEHCKYLCAWKGGGPCLADDCPRKKDKTR